MKLLLDTHTLLWWIADDPRLEASTIAAIENGDNDVLVSIVSLCEIVVKVRTGKMKADLREIEREAATIGFESLPIKPLHLEILVGLPMRHRNPFDHLLIAQAIGENAKIVTQDRQIRGYPVDVFS